MSNQQVAVSGVGDGDLLGGRDTKIGSSEVDGGRRYVQNRSAKPTASEAGRKICRIYGTKPGREIKTNARLIFAASGVIADFARN